jgi:hypothetical protein
MTVFKASWPEHGFKLHVTCKELGVDPRTIRALAEANPDFREWMDREMTLDTERRERIFEDAGDNGNMWVLYRVLQHRPGSIYYVGPGKERTAWVKGRVEEVEEPIPGRLLTNGDRTGRSEAEEAASGRTD